MSSHSRFFRFSAFGLALGAAMACTAASQPAGATLFTLTDGNSTATVDIGSESGMKDWSVDGIDQLYKQWFWYRAGTMTQEQSIDMLTLLSASAFDTGGVSDPDHLRVLYGGSTPNGQTFTVQIDYSLVGSDPGTGLSNMSEQITIKNTSATVLDFHFFQYSDFDLGGTPSDDYAWFDGRNTVFQLDPTPLSPLDFHETVDTPSPNLCEIHTVGNGSDKTPVPGDTVYKLDDGSASSLSGCTTSMIAGDVSWAFEWDKVLQPAGSKFLGIPTDQLTISKLKTLQISTFHERTNMPEPGSLALLGSALTGVAVLRRRRRAAK
jgi:hypothetical protein